MHWAIRIEEGYHMTRGKVRKDNTLVDMKTRTKSISINKTSKKSGSTLPLNKRKLPSISPKNRRPPIVTFMGHVDHGKTTLLDTIRNTNVIAKEHGGITQHIGAYQIWYQGRAITFIDTPGHAAFAKMRAHGAKVTDIVVLVIAANDGVKPQTREAIQHIKTAKVPFLVALNKIDLPEANVERVKGQLAEEGVVVESYGGKIPIIEVSGKTGKNIDQLLEMILLLSDLEELKADPQGEVEAVVIETRQDHRKGILASLLVKNGTLRVGSKITLGDQTATVRALTDAEGKTVTEAGPATPVEMLGLKTLPQVGQTIGGKQEKMETFQVVQAKSKQVLTKKEGTESEEIEKEEEKQTIRVVLKADVSGTLEAITSNLSEEVEIVAAGVGEVNESDILLASATKAKIYAFNTKVSSSAKKLAEAEKVTIKTFNVIYHLFEDLEKQVLKILEPTIDEEVVGEANIIAQFEIRGERIIGLRVTTGEIRKAFPIHLKRGEELIADARIKTLRRGKEDIDTAKQGTECGIVLKPQVDFKLGDMVISYRKIEET